MTLRSLTFQTTCAALTALLILSLAPGYIGPAAAKGKGQNPPPDLLTSHECGLFQTTMLEVLSGPLDGYSLWLTQNPHGVTVHVFLSDNSRSWEIGDIRDPALSSSDDDEEEEGDDLEIGTPDLVKVTWSKSRLHVVVRLKRVLHGAPSPTLKGAFKLPKSLKRPASARWRTAAAKCLRSSDAKSCATACAAGHGVACHVSGFIHAKAKRTKEARKAYQQGCKAGYPTACAAALMGTDKTDSKRFTRGMKAACKKDSVEACAALRDALEESTDPKLEKLGYWAAERVDRILHSECGE